MSWQSLVTSKTTNLRGENEAKTLLYDGSMALREKCWCRIFDQHMVINTMRFLEKGARHSWSNSFTINTRKSFVNVRRSLINSKKDEFIGKKSKKLYSFYYIVQKAKQQCYPGKNACRITEIKLQALLNRTAQHFILYLEDVQATLKLKESPGILIQTFTRMHLFHELLLPIQLICISSNKINWNTPLPWSFATICGSGLFRKPRTLIMRK